MSWAERIAAITGSAVVGSRRLAGDLGGATRIELADGRVIVAKQGERAGAEAAMLEALRDGGAPAPRVLHHERDLLLMEHVEADGSRGDDAWRDLARVLETLHAPREGAYGWDADHAFGPLAIRNPRTGNWARFWGENRLACHAPFVGSALGTRLEALAARLGDLVPDQPPAALLHGDLWGGNILFGAGRVVALIDPACYIGHREVDVAMLTLFDHPPEAFLGSLSLEAGWRERLPIYRLWPLLVHLRLFGSGYRDAVKRALDACGM